MKKALNILILVIIIVFLSNVSFSQTSINSNQDNLAFASQNTADTKQNYVTLEEVPTSALPAELINRVVLSYEKPTFKKAFQVVESGEVVGYEIEFISNSRYNILRYQLEK